MAANEPGGKIGIGPQGRMGGLIQFAVFVILGLFACVYAIPPDFIVFKIIPACLVMLITLVHLAVLGDNWPLAPPGGKWTPDQSRLIPGIGMTVIWLVLIMAIVYFMINIYPKWPLSPLFIWFGTIVFTVTLLYGINWNCWPFKGKMHPWATMVLGFGVILLVSLLVWKFTNLGGTPFENSPFDPQGPVNVNWLSGLLMWFIVWFTFLNPVLTTQGTPFGKLGHPGAAIAQTIVSLILGCITWTGTLSLGMSPTFSAFALAASLIFASYVHSWHLQFWGVTKFTGAKRAVTAFILQVVLAGLWLIFTRIVLGPIAEQAAVMKLPADINIFTLYYSLCVLLAGLIAHNVFWLRWPLTLPMPPGTPPPDQPE